MSGRAMAARTSAWSPGPVGLGDEPRRSHPQEAEPPVDEVEDQGAEGDRTELGHRSVVADDRGVREPE